jgi:formylglycine-generating enzyme required for sulfatase activity
LKKRKGSVVLLVCAAIMLVPVAVCAQGDEVPPDIEALALAGVESNDDWQPYVQAFDDVEMVLIPAGCFLMGSTDDQLDAARVLCEAAYGECISEWFAHEQPAHEICFDEPFWIDRYEVTNAQFAALGGVAEFDAEGAVGEDPRNLVNWYEAQAFCKLRGARLPSEAEWEYAARGPDSLMYPWGSEFEAAHANYCDQNCDWVWRDESHDDGYPYTAPVGSYAGGVSWVGAYDMAGNVAEWTRSRYDPEVFPYPYDARDGREQAGDDESDSYVQRGSTYGGGGSTLRAARRTPDVAYIKAPDLGIRCMRDY